MDNKVMKLYNIIFPIWLLWLIPVTWFIVLPVNFIIDLLVIILTMKRMGITGIKQKSKSVILKVWLFGFVSDFAGTAAMCLSNIIDLGLTKKDGAIETQLGKWWYEHITNAVAFHPFENIYSFVWVTACILLTAFFIYLLNYKISFHRLAVGEAEKKKLALALAVFTAPYLFYLPHPWYLGFGSVYSL